MAGKAFQLFNYVFNFKYNSTNENESDNRQQSEREFLVERHRHCEGTFMILITFFLSGETSNTYRANSVIDFFFYVQMRDET